LPIADLPGVRFGKNLKVKWQNPLLLNLHEVESLAEKVQQIGIRLFSLLMVVAGNVGLALLKFVTDVLVVISTFGSLRIMLPNLDTEMYNFDLSSRFTIETDWTNGVFNWFLDLFSGLFDGFMSPDMPHGSLLKPRASCVATLNYYLSCLILTSMLIVVQLIAGDVFGVMVACRTKMSIAKKEADAVDAEQKRKEVYKLLKYGEMTEEEKAAKKAEAEALDASKPKKPEDFKTNKEAAKQYKQDLKAWKKKHGKPNFLLVAFAKKRRNLFLSVWRRYCSSWYSFC